MDSSNRIEGIEQLSGNRQEEKGSENPHSDSEIDIFTGSEFERPGREEPEPGSPPEQTFDEEPGGTGGENRTSDSKVGIFNGDEHEPEVSQEEETEPDLVPEEPFGSASKEQRGEATRPGPGKGNPLVKERNYRGIGRLSILIAIGVTFFLGMGYICVKYDILGLSDGRLGIAPEKATFSIPKVETITFDSFIVPFKENRRFTYISLSIVFSLPNNEVRKEMSRKRDHIRGILYDMFIDEINRAYRIPPIDHLKKSIIRTVNRTLSVGAVKEVFVTQFLAV